MEREGEDRDLHACPTRRAADLRGCVPWCERRVWDWVEGCCVCWCAGRQPELWCQLRRSECDFCL